MIENLFRGEHLIILLLVVVLLFPTKVGSLGGALGRSIRDFKKALHEDPAQAEGPAAQPPTQAQAQAQQPQLPDKQG
jgi:sec-independent protein translocase protein TatA